MQKKVVMPNEAGQRFSKYLEKYLKEAPKGFIYKMLRKKNIVLNGKKSDGTEKLSGGDEITFWLSDETMEKFVGKTVFDRVAHPLDIIYEDENMLLINKPAGVLSQKAKPEDVSINEQVISYLLDSGFIKEDDLSAFRPSIVNRLDRNTSGMIAAGKTMAGLQQLSALFKERTMHKYYLCLVEGEIHEKKVLEGYLKKDERTNKVRLVSEKTLASDYMKTAYEPLCVSGGRTLLKVLLVTGRTHQIRLHLAGDGHPIVGDYKYGNAAQNDSFKAKYHLKHQLLHAYELDMPKLTGALSKVSGKKFYAPLPQKFEQILKEEGFSWQHGTPED